MPLYPPNNTLEMKRVYSQVRSPKFEEILLRVPCILHGLFSSLEAEKSWCFPTTYTVMCSKMTINILRNRKTVSQSLQGRLVNLVPYSGQVRGSESTLALVRQNTVQVLYIYAEAAKQCEAQRNLIVVRQACL